MSAARVFRHPSMTQQDRLPISTYDEAVRSLVAIRADETVTDGEYQMAVSIIADIFWRGDRQVRRDVILAARDIGV